MRGDEEMWLKDDIPLATTFHRQHLFRVFVNTAAAGQAQHVQQLCLYMRHR